MRYQQDYVRETDRSSAALLPTQLKKVAQLDALMQKVFEATFDAILTVEEDGRIAAANTAAALVFGYPRAAMDGMHIERLLPEFQRVLRPRLPEETDADKVVLGHRESIGARSSGTSFPVDVSVGMSESGLGRIYVLAVRDITEMREQQKQLEHQALHDALTGLPNRVLLANRIEHALAAANRNRKGVALLLLDLDRFKEVNDTLGHHVGDALLRELAKRLLEPVRSGDTVARLGGDEFAVLLPNVETQEQAQELAGRLLAIFRDQFQVEGDLLIEVGCSIGIAMFPDHSTDPAKLMQCADVAMYAAKQGPEKIVLYDPGKDTNSVRQLTLSGELRQAINENKLTIEYQPKLHLTSQTIKSVEALARWRHERLGYVPPTEFVTHAEQTGLIHDLSRWSLEAALTQLAAWHSTGYQLNVAINLSARMLHSDSMIELAKAMLRDFAVPPHLLTMEITESALVVDPDVAKANVRKLHDLGVRLSIDDFGTGYSSLSLLQQLPLNELKIDKSFVLDMLNSHANTVIVRSTIDLAHNLGLEVVAEGVESFQHIEALAGLGCDMAQGYFIARPLPGNLFKQWLDSTGWAVKRQAA
jgi:diguanylate cyclase (GGDEF)-like protein/PAS domain S-box-containing protein